MADEPTLFPDDQEAARTQTEPDAITIRPDESDSEFEKRMDRIRARLHEQEAEAASAEASADAVAAGVSEHTVPPAGDP
ncbi:MAG: hypothetical protein ACJ761_09045, partial [Chloroflexota bacterium]